MAIDVGVGASADDASELGTTVVSITANPLANCDTANVWNGFRFTGISIPANSIITSAYLTVRMTSSTLDEPDVTFWGQNAAAPAQFAASNGNISQRARTAASAAWSNTNAGTGDVQTASLVAIIQELVNGFAPYSSGVMAILMTSRAADGTRDTSITSYDGSATTCARLHIDFNLQLLPNLVSDGDTLYAPTLTLTFNLSPSLVSDGDTLYAPTLTMGAISITPALLDDGDTLYAPTVGVTITLEPALLDDPDTIYAPTIALVINLEPALLDDGDTLYTPSLAMGAINLDAALLSDPDTLYAPSLGMGAINLDAALLDDPDILYAPSLAMGAITVEPALLTNTSIIYAPALGSGAAQELQPALFANVSFVYTPALSQPVDQSIVPDLLSNGGIVYLAILTLASLDRTLFLEGESRLQSIAAEGRGVDVPADGRTVAIPAPDSFLTLAAESRTHTV